MRYTSTKGDSSKHQTKKSSLIYQQHYHHRSPVHIPHPRVIRENQDTHSRYRIQVGVILTLGASGRKSKPSPPFFRLRGRGTRALAQIASLIKVKLKIASRTRCYCCRCCCCCSAATAPPLTECPTVSSELG